MSTATAAYSFDVNSQGTNHHFNYKCAKLGLRTALPLLWPTFFVSIYLALNSASNNNFSFFKLIFDFSLYLILLVGGIMLLLNLLRRGGSFIIGETGITKNGTLYPYTNIHNFYVKSPKGNRGVVIVRQHGGGYGVGGAMQGIGRGVSGLSAEAGEALKNSIRNKSYKVCIQYAEKEITLARAITEKTAKVILQKIDELI